MHLSEAMRLGAMLKPQAFEELWVNGGSCAMGAAAAGFRAMAAADPAHWVVLDAAGEVDAVTGAVVAAGAGATRLVTSVWDGVVGQGAVPSNGCGPAAADPVHAYLFVGPPGLHQGPRRPGVRRAGADGCR